MKSLSLYNGSLLVEFDEVAHVYTCNGERWANVSSAGDAIDCGKSQGFIWWAVNEMWDWLEPKIGQVLTREDLCDGRTAHQRKKEDAAGVGRLVHDYLDAHLKAKMTFGDPPALPNDERALTAIRAYLQYENEHRIRYLASEQIVASLQHRYIGTLDNLNNVATVDDQLAINDYKTSKSIRKGYRPQLSAYCMAWNEMHPDQPIWRRVIHKLPTDEEQSYYAYDCRYNGMTDEESTRFDFNAFLYALWLKHQWDPLVEAHMPADKAKKKDRTKGKRKAA